MRDEGLYVERDRALLDVSELLFKELLLGSLDYDLRTIRPPSQHKRKTTKPLTT